MPKEEAAKVLIRLEVRVSEDHAFSLVPYISSDDTGFTLDGDFTLETLEALIMWHKDRSITHLVNATRGDVIFEEA